MVQARRGADVSADAARTEIMGALMERPEVFAGVMTTEPGRPWRRHLWRSADGLRAQVVVFAVRWGHG